MPITPKPLEVEIYCRDCGTYLQGTWNRSEISVEPCQCPLNEIRKVYELYKHMDRLITDPILHSGSDFRLFLLAELWQAIKASVELPDPLPDDLPTPSSSDTGCSVP